MKLAVIGGGNMGSAIIRAWLSKKVCKPSDILVYERNVKKRDFFIKQKIQTAVDDFDRLKKYDAVLIAVKPQDMMSVLEKIQPYLSRKILLISIAAGMTIKRMEVVLGQMKIVRAMPNTPAQIGMGIVGWTANPQLTASDKKTVQKLLGVMGYAINFSSESKLDAVTAISGSGPAYVFYFMEAFLEASREIGLTTKESTSLVLGTFVGSSLLVNLSGESPADLRAKVTSKKGTTEAAIKVFEKKKLKSIIVEATKKAFERAKELNQ